MGRNFDPIDIIFIVLIGAYLLTLFIIILVLVYGKKDETPNARYKVVKIIKPTKKKAKKKNVTSSTSKKVTSKTNKKKASNSNNVRYKGKGATKKKTVPRKKKPKTNGINKKRKK